MSQQLSFNKNKSITLEQQQILAKRLWPCFFLSRFTEVNVPWAKTEDQRWTLMSLRDQVKEFLREGRAKHQRSQYGSLPSYSHRLPGLFWQKKAKKCLRKIYLLRKIVIFSLVPIRNARIQEKREQKNKIKENKGKRTFFLLFTIFERNKKFKNFYF